MSVGEGKHPEMGRFLALDMGRRGGRLGFLDEGGTPVVRRVPSGPGFVERAVEIAGFHPKLLLVPGGSWATPSRRLRDFIKVVEVGSGAAEVTGRYADSWHPRNRLLRLAMEYATGRTCRIFAVGTMAGGLLEGEAGLSGLPEYTRRAVFHGLEHAEAIRLVAEKERGVSLDGRLVVAYLGEEASVASYAGGQVLDCSNPLAGEGPFGTLAAGTLPACSLVDAFFRGVLGENPEELLSSCAGLFSYVPFEDERELERLAETGEKKLLRALWGMAYQVTKEIGRAVVSAGGTVDLVVLGGPGFGLKEVAEFVRARVRKWGPVFVVPEDLTLRALLRAGREVSSGTEAYGKGDRVSGEACPL